MVTQEELIELLADLRKAYTPPTREQTLTRIIEEARRTENALGGDYRKASKRDTDINLEAIVQYRIFPLIYNQYLGYGRFAFRKRAAFRQWWHKAIRGEATVQEIPQGDNNGMS